MLIIYFQTRKMFFNGVSFERIISVEARVLYNTWKRKYSKLHNWYIEIPKKT